MRKNNEVTVKETKAVIRDGKNTLAITANDASAKIEAQAKREKAEKAEEKTKEETTPFVFPETIPYLYISGKNYDFEKGVLQISLKNVKRSETTYEYLRNGITYHNLNTLDTQLEAIKDRLDKTIESAEKDGKTERAEDNKARLKKACERQAEVKARLDGYNFTQEQKAAWRDDKYLLLICNKFKKFKPSDEGMNDIMDMLAEIGRGELTKEYREKLKVKIAKVLMQFNTIESDNYSVYHFRATNADTRDVYRLYCNGFTEEHAKAGHKRATASKTDILNLIKDFALTKQEGLITNDETE